MSSFQGDLLGGDRTLGSGALAQVRGYNYTKGLAPLVGLIGWGFGASEPPLGAEVPRAAELCAGFPAVSL